MRVVYHLGVHHTDEGRLVRSLLKNRDALMRQGVVVPGPGRYRHMLRDVVNRLRGDPASDATQEVLLEAISDIDRPERIVLSNDSFICLPERALDEGRLYARAYKTAWLRQVFPARDTVFALGLRDPATFVPALYRARRDRGLAFADFLGGIDPRALRWSAMVEDILSENPDATLVAWCNEDTPLAWGGILRAVAGVAPDLPLDGVLDIALPLLTEAGAETVHATFGPPPHGDGRAFRDRLSGLLGAHAREGELSEEIDLPGWDAALMDDLTAAYDADVARIAAMPGVAFIEP